MEEQAAATEPTESKPLDDGQRFILAMLLSTVFVVVVFAHQIQGNGALSTPITLFEELRGESLDKPWEMGEQLPYRYRPLYRALVLAVYARMDHSEPEDFYGLFVTMGALSLLLAALCFEWYLREIGLSGRRSLAGMVVFFVGFPVFFSYDMPIHTREDFLGYAWIALTLIAVARDRPVAVALLGVVGACVRETCLLGVLPYFLVSKRSVQWKVFAYAVPGVAWLALRSLRSLPGESYAYLSISTAPTLAQPLEALLYLFACFGCLWVAAGLQLGSDAHDTPPHPLLSRRVVLLAFLATAGTGWTMGMIREARITYILFPFVIPLALAFFSSERARRIAKAAPTWIAFLAVLAAGGGFLAWLGADPERVVPLQEYFGNSFHFGVAPSRIMEHKGEQVLVELAYASPLNGPFVLLHLAASAALGVGAFVTREPPGLRVEEASGEL